MPNQFRGKKLVLALVTIEASNVNVSLPPSTA